MGVLTWEDVDYETGVDRGVLYVGDAGYVWNGLVSVDEEKNASDVRSLFLDGVNFLNVLTGRFYSASVSAFSVPKEFMGCLGLQAVNPGFNLTRQPKSRFGFSYRVLKATGYNLHLVYNCLVTVNDRENTTLSDTTDPVMASLTINASPPALPAYKPTAHFILDSERVSPDTLNDIENLLYGTPSTSPTFPTAAELLSYFGDFG